MLTLSRVSASDQSLYVERIEFRGIKNADKYEIVRNSKAMASEKGIFVNVDNLKAVLENNVMVRKFDVSVDGRQLTVTVDERYPLFMLLIVEKNISVPTLSDEKGNIIDSGRFFQTDMPIIILRKDFFEDEDGRARLIVLFNDLSGINSGNRDFAAELEEVEIYSAEELRVRLRNRKTEFMIKNDINGFKRIEKTAAYLDAAGTYPGSVDLRHKRALIRH